MINLEPYSSVNDLHFGSSMDDAMRCFGKPIFNEKNREGETEANYDGFIIRFDAKTGDFREATILPESEFSIRSNVMVWDFGFVKYLSDNGGLSDIYGFLVNFELGIAVTGFHDGDESQKAVHFFRNGDWDDLKEKGKPYSP